MYMLSRKIPNDLTPQNLSKLPNIRKVNTPPTPCERLHTAPPPPPNETTPKPRSPSKPNQIQLTQLNPAYNPKTQKPTHTPPNNHNAPETQLTQPKPSFTPSNPANLAKPSPQSLKTQPTHSRFHNILRFFDALPNFPFTTSETMRDYHLQTQYIRVAQRVVERPKA